MATDNGPGSPAAPQRRLSRNIEEIVNREEADARQRPPAGRVADAIAGLAGSFSFVGLHALLLAGWALINLGHVPGIRPFDPWPFGLLGSLFSLEGVLLASFVLMKQNRMSLREQQRAHLDLQINLLAEQETTKVIQMLERISRAIGIEDQVADAESHEMARETGIGLVHEELRRRLRDDAE
jgi:uncharacterized membrane protein